MKLKKKKKNSSYSNISFHGNSQRLAVGTPDGCVIIYDLKTATRWQVLEVQKKNFFITFSL